MVPLSFVNFFSTLAAVGATLFGLIFVVISIKPEVTDAENTSVMRQVQIASSYSALLNPLVISLMALMPQATIGNTAIVMSTIGLINTISMGVFLLRDSRSLVKQWNTIIFILASLTMYGFEIFYAIQLKIDPGDISTLENLAVVLILIYLYGIARAWDLVGARQFHIQEVLNPLISKGIEEFTSDKAHAEQSKETNRHED